MATLKQKKLLKAMEHHTELKAAGIEAGYKMDKGGRTIYREGMSKLIEAHIGTNPQAIIERYEDLIARCKADDDKATERAALDSLSRINAMFKDKSEITTRQDVEPTMPLEDLRREARGILQKLDNDTLLSDNAKTT